MAKHLQVLIIGADSRDGALEKSLKRLKIKGSALGTLEQFSPYGVQLLVSLLFLCGHFIHMARRMASTIS